MGEAKMAKKRKPFVTKRVIGFLHSGADKQIHKKHIDALLKSLESAGYDDGGRKNNLQVKAKLFADDDLTKLITHGKSLINTHKVEIFIAAGGSASAQAAKTVTSTQLVPTPVVFTSVSSPRRPAPNMTGVCARTSELDPVRLRLLNELMPDQVELGALVNSDRPGFADLETALNDEAKQLGLKNDKPDYHKLVGSADQDEVDWAIDEAFKDWNSRGIKGAVITADPLFNDHRDAVIASARKYKVAAIYQWSEFVDDGGLMSYGTSLQQGYEVAADYVGRILDDVTAAGKLPVVTLTKLELVINQGAASGIPIGIPKSLYARADRIIP
jgi:putative ABC transport system substrate-binding protein